MRIRVSETLTADGRTVEAAIYIGVWGGTPALAGALTADVDAWLLFLRRLDDPYSPVERDACPTCRCRGHLGDICLAGVVRDGLAVTCGCDLGAETPIVLTPGDSLAEVIAIDRHCQHATDGERDAEHARLEGLS